MNLVKTLIAPALAVLFIGSPAATLRAQTARADLSRDYPIKPVPFTRVHLNDSFWAPRLETNRKVSIPTAFQQCERTGRIENFVRAAEAIRGEKLEDKHPPGHPFDDTDPYKVIEGASYSLAVHPDAKLEAYVDGLIQKIAAAQEPDGYLYTTRSIDPEHPHKWAGAHRWEQVEVLSHELYNLGHLYEAAVAYYQATGKRSLLDVATKSADLLVKTFGPGKLTVYPGHQIVEMGLVKLYRVTGRDQYLKLAKFFLDSRGGGRAYNQADVPVIEQNEAEGHAVRATYMYSGMADVAALTGDKDYLHAIDEIWNNVASRKIYVTGGIGALHEGEAFGANYQLPNMSAYNETCASVGEDFWNQRLFLLHGDAKYVDLFEKTLYNGLLSGVSLDGKTYFYPNPLESNGQHRRSPWFGVACCPGNITRFMPSIPGYVYGEKDDTLYVNLYMSNKADIELDNGRKLTFTQETRYPWDGNVKMRVDPQGTGIFTVKVRIPGWARNEAIAGDLYRFADPSQGRTVTLRVNGQNKTLVLDKGYVALTKNWKKDDRIELALPMPVRRVLANEKVEADRHRVALQRGPVMYCLEWPDSPSKHVRNVQLKQDAQLKAEWRPEMLRGVEVIATPVVAYRYDPQDKVKTSDETIDAIPYYAWANRGQGQMEVWIADTEAGVHPAPHPSLASESQVTVSGSDVVSNGIKEPKLVADGERPSSSHDGSSYYDWLPKKGTREWIAYNFPKVTTVSSSEVYWYQPDKGEIKVPASWRLLYQEGDSWKPVEAGGNYGLALDGFNKVTFKPVETTSMRLEIQMQPDHSAAISEWHVQ